MDGNRRVNFSSPYLSENYSSVLDYPSGFLHVPVNLTSLFLDSVLQDGVFPDVVISEFDLDDLGKFVKALEENWQETLTYNWRLVTCFVLGAIFALLLPIIGIIWCGCQGCCCCRSKKNNNGNDARRSVKKERITTCCLGALMLVMLLLTTACMTWYMSADVVANIETEKLGPRVGDFLNDGALYMSNSEAQVLHLTDENYREMSGVFGGDILAGADRFELILLPVTTGFYELVNITGYIDATTSGFEGKTTEINAAIQAMNDALVPVSDSVAEIKGPGDLDTIITAASGVYDTSTLTDLRTNLAMGTVPPPTPIDFAAILDNIIPLVDPIHALQLQLVNSLELMVTLPEQFTNDYAVEINQTLEDVHVLINSEVEKILEQIHALKLNNTDDIVDTINDVTHWGDLTFSLLLIPFAVLFVVLILYLCGLLCGSFGKVGGGAKRHGANCMTAGTMIFFIGAFIVWILCTVLFLFGAAVQEFGCKTLEDSENSQVYSALEVQLNEKIKEALNMTAYENVNWTLPEILGACEQNQGLYRVMHIDYVYNVTNLTSWEDWVNPPLDVVIAEITAQVDAAITEIVEKAQISDDDQARLTLLSQQIDALSGILFEIFAAYQPSQTFDSTILNEINDEINNMITAVNDPALDPEVDAVSDMMARAITNANAFEESANNASRIVQDYELDLTYNGMTMEGNVARSIQISEEAVNYINTEGRANITHELNYTMNTLVNLIDEFVVHSVTFIEEDLAGCRPVYDMYYGMVRSVCWRVVDPFNALWGGLGLCLLLVLPMLIVACNLSGLYRRSDINLGQASRIATDKTKRKDANNASALNPIFTMSPEEAGPSGTSIRAYTPSDFHPAYSVVDVTATAAPIASKSLNSESSGRPNGGKPVYGRQKSGYDPVDVDPIYDVGKVHEVPAAYRVLSD